MSIRRSLRSVCIRVGGLAGAIAALAPSIVLGQRGTSPCDGVQTILVPTSTVQQIVVPLGMNVLTVDAAGAQGGDAVPFGVIPGNPGGNGARLTASFPVISGETLQVVVGEAGEGAGYVGGGGGGSFVYRTPDLAGLLIAAAGGGGGSAGTVGLPGSASTTASNGQSNDVGTGGVAGTGGNGGAAGVSPVGCAGGGGGGLLTDGGNEVRCGTPGGKSVVNGSAGGPGARRAAASEEEAPATSPTSAAVAAAAVDSMAEAAVAPAYSCWAPCPAAVAGRSAPRHRRFRRRARRAAMAR